ncbi:MAG: 3-oxoacyl-ACP reductase FabG [Gammaproteobacteria bacterium]|nr:3-oxoacyl-ACP reductase FabG [Gammaproteobacteria bacterium]
MSSTSGESEGLTSRVALVTGASRGIGHAIALELGRLGASLVGTATSDAGVSALAEAFDSAGIDATAMRLDVTDSTSVGEVIRATGALYSAPTILVNNAGITRDGLLMRMGSDDWDDIIETNLSSVYRMSKACLRGMSKARWGRIISIGSVVGAMGNAGQTNYAAAKAGLIGFSRSLAKEVGSRGITVNAVAPGFIETDMTRALGDEQRDALLQNVPLQRLGSCEEVAKVVAFLASESAGYITGETVHINGGLYMG